MKKNILKKVFSVVLSAAILLGGISAAEVQPVQAATPKYKAVYSKILNNRELIGKYSDVSYLRMYFGSKYKWDRYFYYDLDKNGTPELFISSKTMGLTQIFTYNKKLISLGYYDIDRINTARKEIIVRGHWHGAGGSGNREWSVYSMDKSKKKMKMNYYIDILGGKTSVISNGKLVGTDWRSYKSVYNKHIKTAKKFSKFKVKKFMQATKMYGTYKGSSGSVLTIKKKSGRTPSGYKYNGILTTKKRNGAKSQYYVTYVDKDNYIQLMGGGKKVVGLLRLGVNSVSVEYYNKQGRYYTYKRV